MCMHTTHTRWNLQLIIMHLPITTATTSCLQCFYHLHQLLKLSCLVRKSKELGNIIWESSRTKNIKGQPACELCSKESRQEAKSCLLLLLRTFKVTSHCRSLGPVSMGTAKHQHNFDTDCSPHQIQPPTYSMFDLEQIFHSYTIFIGPFLFLFFPKTGLGLTLLFSQSLY